MKCKVLGITLLMISFMYICIKHRADDRRIFNHKAKEWMRSEPDIQARLEYRSKTRRVIRIYPLMEGYELSAHIFTAATRRDQVDSEESMPTDPRMEAYLAGEPYSHSEEKK